MKTYSEIENYNRLGTFRERDFTDFWDYCDLIRSYAEAISEKDDEEEKEYEAGNYNLPAWNRNMCLVYAAATWEAHKANDSRERWCAGDIHNKTTTDELFKVTAKVEELRSKLQSAKRALKRLRAKAGPANGKRQ